MDGILATSQEEHRTHIGTSCLSQDTGFWYPAGYPVITVSRAAEDQQWGGETQTFGLGMFSPVKIERVGGFLLEFMRFFGRRCATIKGTLEKHRRASVSPV
ncbi:MAG TPA: hypothetical protein DEF45_23000 [Rhodopirellula sp.]|nr:hypothetical protein [Rhodopirellula sp.]